MDSNSNPIQMENKTVLILDAGSQYIKLIDKMIRGLNLKTLIKPLDTDYKEIEGDLEKGVYGCVIISGGPDSVYEADSIKCDSRIYCLDIPILGICYGMQLINYQLGGTIGIKDGIREDGQNTIIIKNNKDNRHDKISELYDGIGSEQKVLLTHGDSILELAKDFIETSYSKSNPGIVTSMEHLTKKIYGVQYHPEVDLSSCGEMIFKNFLFNISKMKQNYTMGDRFNEIIKEIQVAVGGDTDKKVIILTSGGVDSSVCLALLHKAINKDQILAIHIDHGFLRKTESDVIDRLRDMFGLTVLNERETFEKACIKENNQIVGPLYKTVDPESKRKIIGDTFIKVVDAYVAEKNIDTSNYLLVQGTLRPDLIESSSNMATKGKASVIKTHHNDSKLVREMRDRGLVLEPLKDLHKNEVRQIGRFLGLPDYMVDRNPFPGPGLAIRVICTPISVNYEEYVDVVNSLKASSVSVFTSVSEKKYLEVLPIKSVGVQGDVRTYSYMAVIKNRPYTDDIYDTAKNITQSIRKINRVLYKINSDENNYYKDDYDKDEGNYLNPSCSLNRDTLEILREFDHVINNSAYMQKYKNRISQMPIILLPISDSASDLNKISIVIRPVTTTDFMTALPFKFSFDSDLDSKIDFNSDFNSDLLRNLYSEIKKTPYGKFLSNLYLDVTGKPPGTIEYE